MTPQDLAALHGRCFAAHPRPWTAAEFQALLAGPANFLLIRPQAFLLGRAIADEAELLTLAVAPEARRQGLASALLAEFAATSRARGARAAFLEVAADNAAALALYAGAGWEAVGKRRDYYAPGIGAIVMRRAL
ncbi:ribosomal-protein-alanine N-acetyltransferase [Paracoccus thiocyanatus]|uniref:Ribosomal-protein-alanine N-acetyltransferase n=1 Tax=Paracoccus thiocyanatus TaxID=34006 RepID=A0A1N6R2G1_9RHOB|nr:GNAT family N-acetyltransferase [Paracoccus thiocyanatus]SIQ23110.1 ribosomal-protein-alanine N-acetyltransferase [Paracoccus thiocyanatus]